MSNISINISITQKHIAYNWVFSHDVNKIKFYFHDVSEQLKTNLLTTFRPKWVLGFVIGYA